MEQQKYEYAEQGQFGEYQEQEGVDASGEPVQKKAKDDESKTKSCFTLKCEKLVKSEKFGEKVNNDLTKSINEFFSVGMGDEVFKLLKKKVLWLENCDGLREVRVNSVV